MGDRLRIRFKPVLQHFDVVSVLLPEARVPERVLHNFDNVPDIYLHRSLSVLVPYFAMPFQSSCGNIHNAGHQCVLLYNYVSNGQ